MRGTRTWPIVLLATGLCVVGCDCGDDDDPSGDAGDSGRDADSRVDGGPDADGSRPDGDATTDGPTMDADGTIDGMTMDGGDGGTTTSPPTTFTVVASEGFTGPTDAVASPDGTTFYFAAYNPTGEAALFSVPAGGGTVDELFAGVPLGYVSGLEISPDGETIYLADSTGGEIGNGAIYSFAVGSDFVEEIVGSDEEVRNPNALAITGDGNFLYISGKDDMNRPAIFMVSTGGGMVDVIAVGSPLVSPTGIYFDDSTDTLHVLDHLAGGSQRGAVFIIEEGATPVLASSGLLLGTPAGISLVSGGGTAVISGHDFSRAPGLYIVTDLGPSPTVTFTALPTALAALDPAGLRTARAAGVFVIVDSEGNQIIRGE